tara:strand:+ start:648 stop:1049 length:402 start_codon:yes stop_codon:yes gene_type:complete
MIDPQITKNFHLKEWSCKTTPQKTGVPWDLVPNVVECAENLQVLRDHIGKAITLISGWRSPLYNKKIGGATKSKHMTGQAADIRVKGMKPDEIAEIIETLIEEGKMKQGGLGVYPKSNFVHYDCRGTRARWRG